MKDKVISFIESLKSDRRIETFDEAATKQAIVLRLLSLLGWNTFNISEVTPEYSVGTKRVDYSLRINNSNKVFIEVKRFNEDLRNAKKMIRKEAGIEDIERLFSSITKPKHSSPIIDYYRKKKKELRIKGKWE